MKLRFLQLLVILKVLLVFGQSIVQKNIMALI